MKSTAVILALALVLPARLVSQQAIGNFENKLPYLKDSARIDSLNRLCQFYLESANSDAAERYANLAYKEACALHYIHGMAVALSRQGSIQTHLYSNFVGAERFDRAAIRLFDETTNKNELAETFSHLGFVCFTQCKYDEAFQMANKAYQSTGRTGTRLE